MKRIFKHESLTAYLQIFLGSLVGAVAYPLFLVPNHIAPGGLTGLATVIHFLVGFPVGLTSFLLNVPLFVVGYRAMGRVFVLRSFVATVVFSLLIDIIPLPPMTQNPLLGAVFGGVLLGVGLGLILRGGATTGRVCHRGGIRPVRADFHLPQQPPHRRRAGGPHQRKSLLRYFPTL